MSDSTKLLFCAVVRYTAPRSEGTSIGYPAEAMRCDAIAGWMRRQGVTVDVTGVDDLDWAVVAGIGPSHIVMHGFDEGSGAIALDYGVGRVIVDSAEQVAMLRASATRPQGILLDITDACLDDPATVDRRVWLDGLHYPGRRRRHRPLAPEILFGMIAEMALISRNRAAVLPRLSVGDVDLTNCDGDPRSLRRAAGTIDEVGKPLRSIPLSAAPPDPVAPTGHPAARGLGDEWGMSLTSGVAPIAQLAEAADLKSAQCRFESDWGHRISAGERGICLPACLAFLIRPGVTPARARFTRGRLADSRQTAPLRRHRLVLCATGTSSTSN